MTIRNAVLGDAEGIARVQTRSWQSAYWGIITDEYLDGLQWEARFKMWSERLSNASTGNVLVAIDSGGSINGFAAAGEVRDEDLAKRNFFEIYAIYVAPEIWGLGVGKSLIDSALAKISAGARGVSLWVLRENTRGRTFYERQGFVPDGTSRIERIGDLDLEEVRYVRIGNQPN